MNKRLKAAVAMTAALILTFLLPCLVSAESGRVTEPPETQAEETTAPTSEIDELEEYIKWVETMDSAYAKKLRTIVEENGFTEKQQLLDYIAASTVTDQATDFTQQMIQAANDGLAQIGNTLKNFTTVDNAVAGVDPVGFARNWESVFKIVGYALVLICWSVGIIETAFQFELMTAKGLVKTFGKILFAKIWIDLSVTICGYIIAICTEITVSIVNQIKDYTMALPEFAVVSTESGIWMIGPLIDMITSMITSMPALTVAAIAWVISAIVMIKLIMRTFELAMLTTVSPAFFACWVSDETKMFFKRFLTTFIGVAVQVVFIAIVYAIAVDYMSGAYNDAISGPIGAVEYFAKLTTWVPVIVAMGIMMIKPPKILTGLIG